MENNIFHVNLYDDRIEFKIEKMFLKDRLRIALACLTKSKIIFVGNKVVSNLKEVKD